MATPPSKPPSPAEVREARLASALRANLKRRKNGEPTEAGRDEGAEDKASRL